MNENNDNSKSYTMSKDIYDFVNMFPGAHKQHVKTQLNIIPSIDGVLASLETHGFYTWEDNGHLYPMWCNPTCCQECENCPKEDKSICMVREFYEKRQVQETQLDLFKAME